MKFKILVALPFFLAGTFVVNPTTDVTEIVQPPVAEAGLQWSCVAGFGAWFSSLFPAGRVLRIGAAAAGLYGFSCPTNLSNYPHGRCIEWRGPRARCSLYEDGYRRFG